MGNCNLCTRSSLQHEHEEGLVLLSLSNGKLPPLKRPSQDSEVSVASSTEKEATNRTAAEIMQQVGHFCVTYGPLIMGALSLVVFLAIIYIVVTPAKQVLTTTTTTTTTFTTTTWTVSHSTFRHTGETRANTAARAGFNGLPKGHWTQIMSMTVENLDYTKLTLQRKLLDDFRSSVCKTVAAETGDSLAAEEIRLQIMPGSVRVVANVNSSMLQGPPPRLRASEHFRARLVASISGVADISAASTGDLSVVDLRSVPKPSSWVSQHGMMLAIVAYHVSVVLAMIVLCRRYCSRVSIKGEAPPADMVHATSRRNPHGQNQC